MGKVLPIQAAFPGKFPYLWKTSFLVLAPMVWGSWIFHCTHQDTHKLPTHTHTALCSRLEQTPAPLSGLVVNRWGKSQLLWQAKHNNTIPLGERRKAKEKGMDGGRQEKKRCQLGCRWAQILCILPDNDGRRTETMREDRKNKGGGQKEGGRERETGRRREHFWRENQVRSQQVNPGGNKKIDTESSPSVSVSAAQTDLMIGWLAQIPSWLLTDRLTEWLPGCSNHHVTNHMTDLIRWPSLTSSLLKMQNYVGNLFVPLNGILKLLMVSGFQNYISLCNFFFPSELLSSFIAYAKKQKLASQVQITGSQKKQMWVPHWNE